MLLHSLCLFLQQAYVLGGSVNGVFTNQSPITDFDSIVTPGRYYIQHDNAMRNAENVPDPLVQAPAFWM